MARYKGKREAPREKPGFRKDTADEEQILSQKPLAENDQVMKYGFSIGHAIASIEAGEWVHTHNMKTNLSGEIEYTYNPKIQHPAAQPCATFQGFRRKDGKVGIRNEIWIIPTVGCVNDIAKGLVRENQDLVQGSIDGLYTFTHPFGCSQTGEDMPRPANSWWP
jgi:altronate hydrolase